MSDEALCKAEVDRMLKNSQTKVIFPILTLALVREYSNSSRTIFSDSEIRKLYEKTVKGIQKYFGHDMHVGGRYYDAYPSRNLPRYGVLKSVGKSQYELLPPYTQAAPFLCDWIPERIKQHISDRLGVVPHLADHKFRAELSGDREQFLRVVTQHIDKNPTNFEIFSFAVIKVHLEKFACKIYRDTRTSAHDRGVDLSTNFGVVYQIKKLKIYSQAAAKNIYAELKVNFDSERLQDGNVILVIDDISKEVKNYLINMKVQTISKDELLKLASQFEDMEDKEKVLRIVHDEFRREYSSNIK
ncbi:MAG: HaeII family restriction endonuclease [Acidobacteria bacterium]|nr:HaeII family restriction endonuclease [Acidobacteriota bacterium]